MLRCWPHPIHLHMKLLVPCSPWAKQPPPVLQRGAQKSLPTQHNLCSPLTCPPTLCRGCWGDWGLWEQLLWRVHTCSLAIVPARVTPASSGSAWHHQDRRLCGQGGGREKKREREKKSGRTHPLTGKGVVREVANSTEEFRPFLGKPQPGPDALLAAPSRGQLPRWGRRGAQGLSQVSLLLPGRAGSGSSCRYEGNQDGAPQAGLALMAACQRQPGHAGAGTAPWPRNRLCRE